MKNDFCHVASRLRMIDSFNHKFNEHIEILSTSNEKVFEFLFLTVYTRLHRRRYHLFSNLRITYFSFRSSVHHVRKQRNHVDVFQMSFRLS